MLRMSYGDHFLSVVRLSVHPFQLTFSNDSDLIWSRLTSFAQMSYGASAGWGNERFQNRLRSVDQDGRHAHIWYKSLKLFYSRTEDALELNVCTNHRRHVTQMMIICWCLTFLRQGQVSFSVHCMGPINLYGKTYWEFQSTSPLKRFSNFAQIWYGASLV